MARHRTRPVLANYHKNTPRDPKQVLRETANPANRSKAKLGLHAGSTISKTYGEEVRQYETVTGLRSGLVVSAKSFGHGIGDGIKDIVAKQIDGAEKNGVIGSGTGLATGVANVVCKPTAGVSGLVSYSSLGLYRSIRKIGASKKEDPAEEVRSLGEAECRELGDADRLFIVRRWCQTQMHVNID
ncbi:hypothetical protein A1F96_07060 [Pyrenophora tritici-repentis]|nr:hypothetical protein A1F96_07060 [Pyrenophora tritici-repentis]